MSDLEISCGYCLLPLSDLMTGGVKILTIEGGVPN